VASNDVAFWLELIIWGCIGVNGGIGCAPQGVSQIIYEQNIKEINQK